MAPSPFLLLLIPFFLLPHLPLHSAQEQPIYHPRCPPFDCGSLGKIHFPFSNTTHPECGLLVVNCTVPTPKIELEGGRWYDIENISYGNESIFPSGRIVIHDQELRKQLRSYSCDSLNNFMLPLSPLIFFEIKNPNLALYKCKHDPALTNYFSNPCTYKGCSGYDIYYWHPEQSLPERHPPQCSIAHLPMVSEDSEQPPGPPQSTMSCFNNDLFGLLAAEFSLQWHVPPHCWECHMGGGKCLTDSNEKFSCSKHDYAAGDDDETKMKIGIGVGTGVGGILLTCFFFLMYQRHKKHRSTSSTLISRNISPDPSFNPDLEKGSTYFQTPIFTYNELEEATNNFDSSNELGDGGFGTVYYGELRDGRVVAVKRLYENNCKRAEQFMNEVTILSLLRHQNLVSLYGCTSRHSRELLLVYEFVPNGTVADHLHGERVKPGMLTWPIRLSIAIESAGALAYLHASDIIHRDVKTNNILLDNGFHVKVADFGLSRLFPTDVTHVSTAPQGTPGYVDPEYYQCYQLTDKSDIYSFGVVLIELISSKPAVDINRHRHEINLANLAINKIHNHALHELVDSYLGFESNYSTRRMITSVAELAFRCLQQDKDMRPSMVEVVEVLRGIESEEYKVEKAEEMDIPADDVGLLKNIPPFSPDTVTDKWVSISSTPNTSGPDTVTDKWVSSGPDTVTDKWVSISSTPNTRG